MPRMPKYNLVSEQYYAAVKNLEKLLREHNQAQIARLLGVTKSEVCRLCGGHQASSRVIYRLAEWGK